MMPRLLIALLVVSLAGCHSLSVASDYDWVKQQDFKSGDVDWVVLDRPAESRLLLRPSMADVAAAGQMAKDLGIAKSINGFDKVIADWFAAQGRRCSITREEVIQETWRQFFYACQ